MAWLLAIPTSVIWLMLGPFLFIHPRLRGSVRHRLGWVPKTKIASQEQPVFWLHGASAGDVLALIPLAKALRQRFPHSVIRVSAMTNTGVDVAKQNAHMIDDPFYLPFDLPLVWLVALKRIRADVAIFECAELWPYAIRALAKSETQLVLQNARFSEHRMHRYKTLFAIFGHLLQAFDLVLLRHADELERAKALGLSHAKMHITGNTKFDQTASVPDLNATRRFNDGLPFPSQAPRWVFGSSHEPEESMALAVWEKLRQKIPDLRLIIAPRHIERAASIHTMLAENTSYTIQNYTAYDRSMHTDILLIDCIGKLSQAYGCATVITVGGSFMKRGGHNIMEPAAHGKAVTFGPHMHNVEDTVRVLLGRGGLQVTGQEQLYEVLLSLLQNASMREELGSLAQETLSSIHGAAARNAELIGEKL